MTTHTQFQTSQEQNKRDFAILASVIILWWIIYTNLQTFADLISYQLLGLDSESHLGQSVNFFIYDVPKILLLLAGMIFLITLVRTFITPEQTRCWLGGRREGIGNILASLLGVVTPFCSCSAVPLFIGFVESGVPLGITFSFLVTAPMVNEVALVMLLGLFGWKIALLYMFSGLSIAILSGVIIGRMNMEHYVEEFVYQIQVKKGTGLQDERLTWHERFAEAIYSTREIIEKVWLYVVIGIAIGAAIHGYIPDDFLAETLGSDALWSVPVTVLFGVPLYSNAAGIIPVVSVLMDKGVALGTVLAFMMSVVALSLPELIILRRVLKLRLIIIYVSVVTTGIIITGYIFNLLI